ncbi:MAG: formate--tetrahydrofolate ligase [Oscillospiraceae bacterium]
MDRKRDLEIAQSCRMSPIEDIAGKIGIGEQWLECYGKYKAKVDLGYLGDNKNADGKLILVTAITPTPAGEGKTTTAIGLADGLRKIGKNAAAALREPSLGPVFGIKGGACGGGYAQIVPMEDINLHFTGDIHAIGAANNLLAAMIDNHIMHGNALDIDTKRITWRRCVDMNDRQLRYIRDGLGGEKDGVERDDGFDITVASEIMAILCLAESAADLKARLARIVIGYDTQNRPVTCSRLKAQGAMAALLKDAIKPNIVQTLEGTPAFVHGGPFANIAHGCNSVLATRMALKAADYAVTEAGFGADLGAEKFLDIKCRASGLRPAAVVVVATVRALKMHGGLDKSQLDAEDLAALEREYPISCAMSAISKTCIICRASLRSTVSRRIPRQSLSSSRKSARSLTRTLYFPRCGRTAARAEKELAEAVVRLCEEDNSGFSFCYEDELGIEDKISAVVRKIYGGRGAVLLPEAKKQAEHLTALGFGKLPVCIAKTQSSFSDDAKKSSARRRTSP